MFIHILINIYSHLYQRFYLYIFIYTYYFDGECAYLSKQTDNKRSSPILERAGNRLDKVCISILKSTLVALAPLLFVCFDIFLNIVTTHKSK